MRTEMDVTGLTAATKRKSLLRPQSRRRLYIKYYKLARYNTHPRTGECCEFSMAVSVTVIMRCKSKTNV